MTVPDLTLSSDAEVTKIALAEPQIFGQVLYIDELARRALENSTLLGTACEAISLGRKFILRRPPPGWLGGARILSSGNDVAIRQLLQAMNAWAPHEQEDFLRAWAGNRNEVAAARSLAQRYDWVPKF